MLEKLPAGIGHTLRGVRAGFDRILSEQPDFVEAPDVIRIESPAFEDGGRLPAAFTADGEGLSPPLTLGRVPPGTRGLVLVVEDPDAPAPEPFVHLLSFDLPPDTEDLPEGLFRGPHHEGLEEDLGRNAFHQAAYLPPDPPPGHGPHLYCFQVFALNMRLNFDHPPKRSAVADAMMGRVLGKGLLVATYVRPGE